MTARYDATALTDFAAALFGRAGLDTEKARVTAKFLQIRVREYEALRAEIEQIRIEAERQGRR